MADAQVPNIGTRVREARAEAGITQQDLAEKTGATLRAVQMWEYGERMPRVEWLGKLALALDKPVAYFFEPASESVAETTEDAA